LSKNQKSLPKNSQKIAPLFQRSLVLVSEKGPPHRKTFRAKVMLKNFVAHGIASSKREAQKKAAKNLLKKIKTEVS